MQEKIWILIHKTQAMTFENNHIKDYLKKNNLKNIEIKDIKKMNIDINKDKFIYFYDGKEVLPPQKIYPKIGCSLDEYDYDILKTCEKDGIRVINTPDLLKMTQNKFLLSMELFKNNILSLNSMNVTGDNANLDLIENKFSYPLVLKSKVGSLGIGIYLIDNKKELQNMIDQIKLLDKEYNYLIQEYIKTGNSSIRVVVFKGKIQYVVEQTSKTDFRSNYSRGAKAQYIEADEGIKDMVSKIYKIIPMGVMGIDFFKQDDKYIVCEINSNPGFKSYNETHSDDFTKRLITFLDEI